MRHQQVHDRDSYRTVDVAAVWPSAALVSPTTIPEIVLAEKRDDFVPTPAAPDVPAGAWMLLATSYFALVGAFALAAAGSAQSVFAIVIAFLFVVTFFAIPRLFFRIERGPNPPPFERFLREGIDTLTGPCGGSAALLQMLIVPVLLTCGALAMAVAAAIIF